MNLQTERLLLRRWKDSDLDAYAAMNADPAVMEHFPKVSTYDETKASMERIENSFEQRSYGLWAVELISSKEFIGFAGLWSPTFEAHFTPCVEIGWRLAHKHWGKGYAPEAARAILKDGFERLGLEEIVAMTAFPNKNSVRVMEKLGMTFDPSDNFIHPVVADDPRLRDHVLYRIKKSDWMLAHSAN